MVNRWRKLWLIVGVVLLALSDRASALNNATDVLGFESPSLWSTTTPGAVLSQSSVHTQGAFSLAIKPSATNGWTPLFSVPLSSLSQISAMVALDIMLPTQQANPSWYGAVQVYLNCPSRNIYSAYLAEVELTGLPLATWRTLTFPVTSTLVQSLVKSGYQDLTFEVVLNVAVPTTGTYLVDNLRFQPPATCAGQPNGTLCSDGNVCTQTDVCENGVCVGMNPLSCEDNQPCTVDSCNPTTGCQHVAVSCNTRTGEIQAETFDSASGTVASSTAVTPSTAGAWLVFNNVDFGTAGTVGRFEAALIGASANATLELRLGGPTGTLLASLNTLRTDTTFPVPLAVDFVTQVSVSGVQTVAIVFDSTATGSLDWFELLPAEGHASVGAFPPTYQHPGQGPAPPPNNVVDDEPGENDVPFFESYRMLTPVQIAANTAFIEPFTTVSTSGVVGQARWAGPSGNLTIYVIKNDGSGSILATGTTTQLPMGNGWQANVVTVPLAPQPVAVVVANHASTSLAVILNAGAVQ